MRKSILLGTKEDAIKRRETMQKIKRDTMTWAYGSKKRIVTFNHPWVNQQ